MRRNHILNIAASLVSATALALGSCSHDDAHHHHESEHQHGHEASKAHTDEHAPGIIVLDSDAAGHFGVGYDTIAAAPFHAVTRASGTVQRGSAGDAIVSATTSGIVHYAAGVDPGSAVRAGSLVATVDGRSMSGGSADAAAAAELENARRELQRVEALYASRLTTQAELTAARGAYDRAAAAYSPTAATGRVAAPVAGTVMTLIAKEGQYVAAGDPIATIGSGKGAVLRVDLPRRYYADAADYRDLVATFPGGVTLRLSEAGGRRTGGNAADGSGSGAYLPLYFTLPAGAPPAGTPFTAYLIGRDRADVISVPKSALSEQQGRYYVYVHEGGEHYRKVHVEPGDTDGRRTEILSGVVPGDVIVSAGVAAVRLAETSAVAPEGHSHNH